MTAHKDKCKDCKYFDINYEWDGEDEVGTDYCSLSYENIDAEDKACEFFKKQRVYRYKEQDTMCDKCEFFSECTENKLDVTSIEDVKSHYVPDCGVKCRKM